MTKVLVAYATRMGSTAEIAEVVGRVLRASGLRVTVRPCEEVDTVDDYDAVVLGSAMYVQHWLHDAVDFLRRHGKQLGARPTWLFQSGPCGADAAHRDVATPRQVVRLVGRFGLRRPITFGGRLDPDLAPDRVSRWMARGNLAGDFRDWDAIEAWAQWCARSIVSASPRGLSPELAAAIGDQT